MAARVSPVRVVVADGHRLFALGVRSLLAREPGIEVVADATDGRDTLALVEQLRPDVLLLDLAIERIQALELLNRIAALKLPTRTVVVASAITADELRTALLRGARGLLYKHTAGELLGKCIRQVMKGEYWIGRDQVADLVEAMRNPADEPAAILSSRERDIVRAVLKGASNKDIAWQLGLGEQTVKNHLRRIFAKLGVANRVELAVHALARQLNAADQDAAR